MRTRIKSATSRSFICWLQLLSRVYARTLAVATKCGKRLHIQMIVKCDNPRAYTHKSQRTTMCMIIKVTTAATTTKNNLLPQITMQRYFACVAWLCGVGCGVSWCAAPADDNQ